MSYPTNTYKVLTSQGYELDKDFVLSEKDGMINLDWFHVDPKPTESQVLSLSTSTQFVNKRAREAIKAEATRRIETVQDPTELLRDLRRYAKIAHMRANGDALPAKWLAIEAQLNTDTDRIELILDAGVAMFQEVTPANVDDYLAGISDDVAVPPRTINWP